MAASQSAGRNMSTLPRFQVMEKRRGGGRREEDGRDNGVMLHNTINFQDPFEVQSQNLLPWKKRNRGHFRWTTLVIKWY